MRIFWQMEKNIECEIVSHTSRRDLRAYREMLQKSYAGKVFSRRYRLLFRLAGPNPIFYTGFSIEKRCFRFVPPPSASPADGKTV